MTKGPDILMTVRELYFLGLSKELEVPGGLNQQGYCVGFITTPLKLHTITLQQSGNVVPNT
jgi:hypothetical protein